jgi:hypothetical protein
MKASETKLIKKWVNTWKRTGPALEKIRQQELRQFDYASNWRRVDALLDSAVRQTWRPRRQNSLVIIQRYFMKWRKQQEIKSKKHEI